MTTRQISMSLIVASLMVPFRHLQADETIHLTAEEVINIVSQKLDVAQSRKDARALRAAKDNLPAISSGYGKKVYRHLAPEQTFALELKILQVADRMQDKSYDHTMGSGVVVYIRHSRVAERFRSVLMCGYGKATEAPPEG